MSIRREKLSCVRSDPQACDSCIISACDLGSFMNELCVRISEKACCTLQDRHADGRVMPNIDSQQDYELISLKEDNGKTTMKFKRKLDTCDPQDNKIEVGTLT